MSIINVIVQVVKWIDGLIKEGERMREVTIKVYTNELTKQLNELDVSGMTTEDLKRFIQENLEVTQVENSNELELYVKLKESEVK